MTATPSPCACPVARAPVPELPPDRIGLAGSLHRQALDWLSAIVCAVSELHQNGDTLSIQRLAALGLYVVDDFYNNTLETQS